MDDRAKDLDQLGTVQPASALTQGGGSKRSFSEDM